MKIALVNVFFPPQTIGGATKVVSDNVLELTTKYNDQVELVVFCSNSEQGEPYEVSVFNYYGIRVYRVNVQFREHMDWNPKDEDMHKVFTQFLEFEKPDLVHFHCIQRLTASVVDATQALEIPYLITLHDAWWISDYQFLVDDIGRVFPDGHTDWFKLPKPPKGITKEQSQIRRLFLFEKLIGAKKLLAVSDSFTDLYLKNGVPNVITNKNGVSALTNWELKNTENTNNVVIGHIGGMAEHKGFFWLRDIIQDYEFSNIEFLFVDLSKEQEFKVIETWGGNKVTIIGRQSQKKIAALYSQMDVLAAPSLWPESYGLVTREAAISGCWVIASNIGGIGEDIIEGESGFKVDVSNPESLKDVLISIDSEPKKYKGSPKSMKIRKATEQTKELVELHYTI